MSDRQREHIEKSREERAEERAEERRRSRRAEGRPEDFIAPSRGKRTRVTADSAEELLEKIQSVDWDAIKNEAPQRSGGKFDLSI